MNYEAFLKEKFPEIEVDRSDFELIKRAESLETTQSINGGNDME